MQIVNSFLMDQKQNRLLHPLKDTPLTDIENLRNCEKQKTKSSLPEDSSITLPQPQWI